MLFCKYMNEVKTTMPNIFCLQLGANGGTWFSFDLCLTWIELLLCKVEFGIRTHQVLKGTRTFACRMWLVSGAAGLFTLYLSRVYLKPESEWLKILWCQISKSSHWLEVNSKGDDLSETAFDWWVSDWASGPLFYSKWLLVQCGKPPVSSPCQATMLLPSFGSHESEILGLSSVCATILSM